MNRNEKIFIGILVFFLILGLLLTITVTDTNDDSLIGCFQINTTYYTGTVYNSSYLSDGQPPYPGNQDTYAFLQVSGSATNLYLMCYNTTAVAWKIIVEDGTSEAHATSVPINNQCELNPLQLVLYGGGLGGPYGSARVFLNMSQITNTSPITVYYNRSVTAPYDIYYRNYSIYDIFVNDSYQNP